jgi:hypothetical protein
VECNKSRVIPFFKNKSDNNINNAWIWGCIFRYRSWYCNKLFCWYHFRWNFFMILFLLHCSVNASNYTNAVASKYVIFMFYSKDSYILSDLLFEILYSTIFHWTLLLFCVILLSMYSKYCSNFTFCVCICISRVTNVEYDRLYQFAVIKLQWC